MARSTTKRVIPVESEGGEREDDDDDDEEEQGRD